MQVKGQAAMVTGAGSGIGADVARHLATAGAKVAVLDLDMESAAAVAKEIGGLAVACDISDAKSGEDAVAKARAAHGAGPHPGQRRRHPDPRPHRRQGWPAAARQISRR